MKASLSLPLDEAHLYHQPGHKNTGNEPSRAGSAILADEKQQQKIHSHVRVRLDQS
jgi:hypothetical protein